MSEVCQFDWVKLNEYILVRYNPKEKFYTYCDFKLVIFLVFYKIINYLLNIMYLSL